MIRFLLALLLSIPCFGADVPLAWDASTSPNISGYKVYVGPSTGSYNAPIVIGNQTTYTVTGLGPGVWYFAVAAFDTDGNISDFSNEVRKTIATSVILDPPTIPDFVSIAVPSITTQYATISWVTSLECSGTVFYGTAEPLKEVKANVLGTTDHLAVIGPLTSRTHYLFRVESNCNGTTINSGLRSFNSK